MIPVTQEVFGYPDGDCFRACVASILELPLPSIPNLLGDNWWYDYQDWAAQYNLALLTFPATGWTPKGYAMLGGKSPRGDFLHSVVCLNGDVIWDPHPDRAGVLSRDDWTVFCLLDPAQPLALRPMEQP